LLLFLNEVANSYKAESAENFQKTARYLKSCNTVKNSSVRDIAFINLVFKPLAKNPVFSADKTKLRKK
jgi:hypothetical protein